MYRYFIQPQLDKFNNSLIGYEMLIRYRETDQDRWTLPESFDKYSDRCTSQLTKGYG